MMRFFAFLALVFAVACAAAQDPATSAPSHAFDRTFRTAFETARTLVQYESCGKLLVRVVSGDETQELDCGLYVAKLPGGVFVATVDAEPGGRVLARALSTGRQGRTALFLPRELVSASVPSRLGQMVDSYAIPAVITIFDLFDDGRIERWFSMMDGAEFLGDAVDGEAGTDCVRFSLNNYWTLRGVVADLWVQRADPPLPARLDLDLGAALTQRGPSSWVKPGSTVTLSMRFGPWYTEEDPDMGAFTRPSPTAQYSELDLRTVMIAAESGMLEAVGASADPAKLMTQLRDARAAGGNASAIERLKKATPAERRQLMNRARSMGAGDRAGAAAAARQMGLSQREIEQLKKMAP